MEKSNPVRRWQFSCNKSAEEHLHKCSNIFKLKLFSCKEDQIIFFITFFLFNLIIWSPGALQSTCHQINLHIREENISLKVSVVEVQRQTSSRFPATVGCFFYCIY